MASGAGHFQRTLGPLLAADVPKVQRILGGFGEQGTCVQANGLKRFGSVDEVHDLRQGADGIHLDAFHNGRFARVRFRHHDTADALLSRAQGGGKSPAHRPDAAVER